MRMLDYMSQMQNKRATKRLEVRPSRFVALLFSS